MENKQAFKRKRLDTRFDLVAELEKLPKSALINQIIEEAKAGEFHDYKNKKYACGKVAAVHLLRVAGQENLAQRVIDGDFDEEADEDDKAHLRQGLPEAMWDALGLHPNN